MAETGAMLPKTITQIIKKALARALGIGLLLLVSYRVLGHMPGVATWVFLGVLVAAFSVYSAWRDVQVNKPRP